jgi:hypothetical protein
MIRMALRLRGVRVLMDRGRRVNEVLYNVGASARTTVCASGSAATTADTNATTKYADVDSALGGYRGQDAFITGMIYALSKRLLPGAPYAHGPSGSGAAEASRSEGRRWKLGECLTRRLAGGALSPLIFPALPSDLWSRGTVLSMVCRALGRVPDLLRARRACLHTSRLGQGVPKGGWKDELR